jgi:pimeloyl-ACP methyl ester carboxylesterase
MPDRPMCTRRSCSCTVIRAQRLIGGADKPVCFDYTVDGYAHHLGGIIDQLGIQRVHLVLHDFGG